MDLIFRLIFFHQSLIGANDFPPMIQLTKEERLIYCDDLFFKLMRILMIADSCSYMFVMDFDNRMDRCVSEFKENSQWMAADWDDKYKLLKYHL